MQSNKMSRHAVITTTSRSVKSKPAPMQKRRPRHVATMRPLQPQVQQLARFSAQSHVPCKHSLPSMLRTGSTPLLSAPQPRKPLQPGTLKLSVEEMIESVDSYGAALRMDYTGACAVHPNVQAVMNVARYLELQLSKDLDMNDIPQESAVLVKAAEYPSMSTGLLAIARSKDSQLDGSPIGDGTGVTQPLQQVDVVVQESIVVTESRRNAEALKRAAYKVAEKARLTNPGNPMFAIGKIVRTVWGKK